MAAHRHQALHLAVSGTARATVAGAEQEMNELGAIEIALVGVSVARQRHQIAHPEMSTGFGRMTAGGECRQDHSIR